MTDDSYSKLSEGERMVWAAAYAVTITAMYDKGRQAEDAASAIETAWSAVKDLREAVPAVKEAFGADDEVTRMLLQMKHGF